MVCLFLRTSFHLIRLTYSLPCLYRVDLTTHLCVLRLLEILKTYFTQDKYFKNFLDDIFRCVWGLFSAYILYFFLFFSFAASLAFFV